MPIVVSAVLSLRSLVRSRAELHLEILALRHQLQVLDRSRQPRLRLTAADRLLWVWYKTSFRVFGSHRHQFRHIHSSLLNDLKVPVKIAQEQLGHASISTTLNIYTHVVDASHRKAVEAVEERLFVELDPNGPKLALVPRTASPVSARSA